MSRAALASPRPVKGAYEYVTFLASTTSAATAGVNGSALRMPRAFAYAFVLDVTDAANDVTDTLDVFIQTKADGANWLDVVHFTQVLGNGANTLRYVAKVTPALATTEFNNATALGAAAVRNIAGDEWRCRYVIVDGGGVAASFTFSVRGVPM